MPKRHFSANEISDLIWVQTGFIGDIVLTTAAIALARIEGIPGNSIPIFTYGLKHESPQVRLFSAQYIAEIGQQVQSTVPQLKHLLKDPDPEIRSAAGLALKNLGAEKRRRY